MKKIILFIAMAMMVYDAKAQFEIDSIGKIKIGSNTTTTAHINIRAPRTNILGIRHGVAYGIAPVLEGVCFITNSQWAMGVRGSAEGSNGAVNCGLFGTALSSTSNKVYGVFGSIDSNKGAAIYGQAYPWTSSSGVALTAPYAGYFDGNVHVQGNLTYSGTMLTASPNPSDIQAESLSSRSGSSNAMASRLRSLDVKSYYHYTPISKERPSFTDEDFAGMDSMEIEAKKKALAEMNDVKDIVADQVFSKQHYGFNSEELEEVFPDLVYENEDGTKSINYVEMVPILVQAINELNAKLDELEGNGDSMKKTRAQTTSIDEIGKHVAFLSLGQNKPNPFGTTTDIEVSIPDDVQKAFIYVYDLQGKKLQQVDIPAHGKQSVAINASSLTDGMYLYSLIADGKVVETRRMIVEK